MARLNEIDLNLDNYSLDDILNLFNLRGSYTVDDLKVARKIVFKTHPDKSNLDKKYFLFFGNAYNILVKVLRFRDSSNMDKQKQERNRYQSIELTEEQKTILERHSGTKGFTKLFNEMFDREFRRNEGGHGDWLKSDSGLYEEEKGLSKEEAMSKYKNTVRSLVVHNGIQDGSSVRSGAALGESEITDFSSDVFASCRYEDVRKAHTESVIGVTEEDIDTNRPNTVLSLRTARAQQDITPMSEKESNKVFASQNESETNLGTHRAFQLIKEDQRAQEINKRWWGQLKQLHN